jgi:GTP-binding protein Era
MTAPIILVINKIDLSNQAQVEEKIAFWKDKVNATVTVALSALHAFNTQGLLETILNLLPEHPAYFGKDELTDRPERFFAAEIIREKIFLNYQKEVPYSCEVNIEYFKEDNEIIRIGSVIVVERDSQKGIIIGKGGEALKKVGSEARKDMESFFQKKVFLEQFVKVEPDWRKRKVKLSEFGYDR